MEITQKQLKIYYLACRAAYALEEEYGNEEKAKFWWKEFKKLEIRLRIPLEARYPY